MPQERREVSHDSAPGRGDVQLPYYSAATPTQPHANSKKSSLDFMGAAQHEARKCVVARIGHIARGALDRSRQVVEEITHATRTVLLTSISNCGWSPNNCLRTSVPSTDAPQESFRICDTPYLTPKKPHAVN